MSKSKLTPEQKAAIERNKMWHDGTRRYSFEWDSFGENPDADGPTDVMAKELGLPPIPKNKK